jgi:hypothetical protein
MDRLGEDGWKLKLAMMRFPFLFLASSWMLVCSREAPW